MFTLWDKNEDFKFFKFSEVTFDPSTVGTLKTLTGNNACVLMTSLCYVACKDNDFFKIFFIIFGFIWRQWPPINFEVKSIQ